MKTVVLGVLPPNEAMEDFVRVRKAGKGEKVARSSELLRSGHHPVEAFRVE